MKANKRRYNRSAKGRAASARYGRSEKGKARSARYNVSLKGQQRAERYNATPGGIERRQFYERTIRRAMRTPAGNPFGVDTFAGMASNITAQIQERRAARLSRAVMDARQQEIVREFREHIERDGVDRAAAFYSEQSAGDRPMQRLMQYYFNAALREIERERLTRRAETRRRPSS